MLTGDELTPSVDGEGGGRALLPSLMLEMEEEVVTGLPLGDNADETKEASGESTMDEGDSVAADLEGDGVFTGFIMQRLTCLFRLEATPNRRPQVSQTNATKINTRSALCYISAKLVS